MPDFGGEKIGEIFVEVKARTDRLEKDLKDLRGKVEKSASSLGRTFGSFFSKALIGFGAFFGVQQLLGQIRESISLAKEQVKAEKQVAQAIKQTGSAAGFTATQLFKEASALQALTGVGDEISLQKITKQLLTFTQITGDNFLRAQRAILDLNAVINEGSVASLSSQSIQLGKALENPIQGISALSRSGITFTEKQKALIKSLVESNRMFEAQGIILDEIEAKYGGQARALAEAESGTLQMTAAFGDFLERVGKRFLPFLQTSSEAATRFFDSLLRDEPETLRDRLNDLSRDAQQQISQFNKLTSVYIDLRRETKLTAAEHELLSDTINQLKKNYPNYLEQIDLEKGKLEEVSKAFDTARFALQDYLEQRIQLAIIQDKEGEFVTFGKQINALQKQRRLFRAEVEEARRTQSFRGVQFEESFQLEKALGLAQDFEDAMNEGIIKTLEEKKLEIQTEIEEIRQSLGELFEPPKPAGGTGNTVPVKLVPKVETLDVDYREVFDRLLNPPEAQVQLFDKLKFEAEGYLVFRLGQIDQEAEAFRSAGANAVTVEQFRTAELKALWADFYAFLSEKRSENLTEDQRRLQELAEYVNSQFDLIGGGFDVLSDGFAGAMADIRLSAENANSILEKGFVALANSFLAQVQRMAAAWLAFQALQGIAGAFGIALPTQTAAAAVAPAGATGGRFIGTDTGIKKMATGGSFVVPQGYPGDSFPLMVQSGERVSVTPAGTVAQQDIVLKQIKDSLGDLGAMMMASRNKFEFRANIGGNILGNDIKLSYDRSKQVEKRTR